MTAAAAGALGATALLLPNPSPNPVTARPIIIEGRETVWSLAFIEAGEPVIPGTLIALSPLQKWENRVAEAIGFDDITSVSAREQGWVAARIIAAGETPHVWVSVDPQTQTVTNVIDCPSTPGEMARLCASEKPVSEMSRVASAFSRLRDSLAAAQGGASSPNFGPQFIHGGAYGYPVAPAPAGAWHPVVDETFPKPPDAEGLGFWIGQSSGLAYSLAYLDHLGGPLAPEGMRLAATGVVMTSPKGETTVAPIAELPYKLEGAARAGINVVFVPASQDGVTPPEGITVVGVSTVFEALSWLCKHGSPSPLCDSLWQHRPL